MNLPSASWNRSAHSTWAVMVTGLGTTQQQNLALNGKPSIISHGEWLNATGWLVDCPHYINEMTVRTVRYGYTFLLTPFTGMNNAYIPSALITLMFSCQRKKLPLGFYLTCMCMQGSTVTLKYNRRCLHFVGVFTFPSCVTIFACHNNMSQFEVLSLKSFSANRNCSQIKKHFFFTFFKFFFFVHQNDF